jgi:hypothetical protein
LHQFADAAPDVPSLASLLERDATKEVVVSAPSSSRERPNRSAILIACAAIIVIGIVGVALSGRSSGNGPGPADTVGLTPTVAPTPSDSTAPAPSTTTPEATSDDPTVLAHVEEVQIRGFSGLNGLTLSIDAVEHDGVVSGEFRVGNVVVTIQCAGTRTYVGDLILGGVVTANTDGSATLDDVSVAIGDVLALVIRDKPVHAGQRVTLYDPSIWYGEQAAQHDGPCSELVESYPFSLDGGFFDDVSGEQFETHPPRECRTVLC